MFRLLGFLIGSLTSILIILLLVGMPKFHLGEDQGDESRYEAAIEKLRAKQQEIEAVTGKLTEDVARVVESTEAPPAAESGPVAPAAAAESVAAEPVAVANETPAPAEPSWYSFWNPFRSEIAARGFVSQLERVTGLDYRIVRVDAGVYEVAFPYRDDAERAEKLTLISAATGLDLPEG